MLPFNSLDAATATGAGTSKDLEESKSDHFMIVSLTGGPSTISVDLEGSHDGSMWVVLANASTGAGATRTASVVGKPVRYVRANLVELSGGTSPTASVTIASA